MGHVAALVTATVAGMSRREPELIEVIRRLADLEATAFLSPPQMRELNGLRRRLNEEWPEVAAAVAHAYLVTA